MNDKEKLINRLKANTNVLKNYVNKRPYLREKKNFEAELINDIIRVAEELEKVLAWQPLPEPYKE